MESALYPVYSELLVFNSFAANVRLTCHTVVLGAPDSECSWRLIMTIIKQPPFKSQSAAHHTDNLIPAPKIFYDFLLYFVLSWKPAGQGCVTFYFMCVIKQLCHLLRLYSFGDVSEWEWNINGITLTGERWSTVN